MNTQHRTVRQSRLLSASTMTAPPHITKVTFRTMREMAKGIVDLTTATEK